MATDLEILKFNLQEREYPYFDDAELQLLLDQHGDVKTASYFGCLMKANNDSIEVAGIKIPSNSEYWINLATQYKPSTSPNYKTSMARGDGQ